MKDCSFVQFEPIIATPLQFHLHLHEEFWPFLDTSDSNRDNSNNDEDTNNLINDVGVDTDGEDTNPNTGEDPVNKMLPTAEEETASVRVELQ